MVEGAWSKARDRRECSKARRSARDRRARARHSTHTHTHTYGEGGPLERMDPSPFPESKYPPAPMPAHRGSKTIACGQRRATAAGRSVPLANRLHSDPPISPIPPPYQPIEARNPRAIAMPGSSRRSLPAPPSGDGARPDAARRGDPRSDGRCARRWAMLTSMRASMCRDDAHSASRHARPPRKTAGLLVRGRLRRVRVRARLRLRRLPVLGIVGRVLRRRIGGAGVLRREGDEP